jgi:gliding motility-associated lipoprotein GldD
MRFLLCQTILSILLLTASCTSDVEEESFSPKPRGYFRLALPEKKYREFDSLCPFRFEIPVYSHIRPDKNKGAEPCWMNLEFPGLHASVYLSYKPVHGNLRQYLEDAHELAGRHQIKATGMDEVAVVRDSAKVYGLLFDIAGNTATSLQFYLTDSTRHFLRGSLYFNSKPNIDSLKILVDFIREDVMHLIRTAEWK